MIGGGRRLLCQRDLSPSSDSYFLLSAMDVWKLVKSQACALCFRNVVNLSFPPPNRGMGCIYLTRSDEACIFGEGSYCEKAPVLCRVSSRHYGRVIDTN